MTRWLAGSSALSQRASPASACCWFCFLHFLFVQAGDLVSGPGKYKLTFETGSGRDASQVRTYVGIAVWLSVAWCDDGRPFFRVTYAAASAPTRQVLALDVTLVGNQVVHEVFPTY